MVSFFFSGKWRSKDVHFNFIVEIIISTKCWTKVNLLRRNSLQYNEEYLQRELSSLWRSGLRALKFAFLKMDYKITFIISMNAIGT